MLLPGPPREMKPMIEALARERLAPRAGARALFAARAPHRRPDRIARRRDGAAGLRAAGAAQARRSTTTILACSGQIDLHLTRAATDAGEADAAALDAARARAGAAHSVTTSTAATASMEQVVGELLRERG